MVITGAIWALAQGITQVIPVPIPNSFIATPSNPNLLMNGAMQFDQFAAGATLTLTSGAAQRGPADRWWTAWTVSTSGAGDPTVKSQATSAGLTGFPRSFLVTASSTPSTTVPAGLLLSVAQRIEGSDIADLAFGTSGAQQFSVSIWIKTSITNANFSFGFLNNAADRAYPHICNIPTANTWTKCQFTVTADTTGTWLSAPGTIGLASFLILNGGSNFQGTNNTWAAGVGITTSAQTQFTATASATVEFTGVKIERGVSATAYEMEPAAQLFSKLLRYYRKSFPLGTAPAQNAGLAGARCVENPIAVGQPSVYVQFEPPMYAAPTVVTYNPSAANSKWRNVTAGADVNETVDVSTAIGTTGVQISTAATTATIADNLCIHYSASVSLF